MTLLRPSTLSLSVLLAAIGVTTAIAQTRPAALKGMERQGITVVGKLPDTGGMQTWAGYLDQQAVALYITPDGKHAIAGTMLDANGRDVTPAALDNMVAGAMTSTVWSSLEAARWIADGKSDAPRTVYVFTDMNCPYCNKLWSDARPWVDAGKVQLRHIVVGIIKENSAAKAAAVLSADNPTEALAQHSRLHTAENARAMQQGRPRPLSDRGVQPMQKIPPAIQAQIDSNHALLRSLRLNATPALVWKDANGHVKTRTGGPAAALKEIFGPL